MTDDGEFGILITRVPVTLFRFQLIIATRLVGDSEGCLPYSALAQLKEPYRIDDATFDQLPTDAVELMAFLNADDHLHDQTLAPQAESLDGWSVKLFATTSHAVILSREKPGEGTADAALCAVVPIDDYFALAEAAFEHWKLLTTP